MKKTYKNFSRRDFLKSTTVAGVFTVLPSYVALGNQSSSGVGPNGKVNLAAIGIGNQGGNDVGSLHSSGHCNIVAVCDVDLKGKHCAKTLEKHPEAKTFTDFRKMFDEMADEIDAVLIATPDHSHFAATMLAMSLGKHVFVEKPLAHTFGQSERLIQMAQKHPDVVTQMGNQGHSGGNFFQFKAYREAGLIKDVTRITAYMNRGRRWHGWGETVSEYPEDPMPDGLAWDQWHDVVDAQRPYSKRLHPQEWRSWYEFGSGAFGDWGPHILDTAHRFLELGLPERISADDLQGVNDANLVFPQASTIRFSFPERGADLPACDVTWYDGTQNHPEVEEELGELVKDPETGEESRKPLNVKAPGSIMYSKDLVFQRASHGSTMSILPKEKFMDMRRSLPTFPQKNSNHYENFLLACKGEEEARSPFSVSGPLTQVFNLGILAQRFGGELQFDRKTKQITNNSVANEFLDPAPRAGWEEFYKLVDSSDSSPRKGLFDFIFKRSS